MLSDVWAWLGAPASNRMEAIAIVVLCAAVVALMLTVRRYRAVITDLRTVLEAVAVRVPAARPPIVLGHPTLGAGWVQTGPGVWSPGVAVGSEAAGSAMAEDPTRTIPPGGWT